MSTHCLITRWEEALEHALSVDERDAIYLSEKDLEMAAGVAVRSSIRTGDDVWADTDYHGSFGCLFSACC